MSAWHLRIACLAIPLLMACPALAAEVFQPRQLTSLKALKMNGIHRQTLDYSCGAAALAILLGRYFGEALDEAQILADIVYRLSKEEEAERMHEGFSMLDLKQSTERLGYHAAGIMLPIEAAARLEGPVIILLRPNNLKLHHFVVLKGISGGHAFLADPARGHLRMPLFELAEQWHGETLVIGREGFGLPRRHALTPPQGNAVAPEQHVTRTLQQVPAP